MNHARQALDTLLVRWHRWSANPVESLCRFQRHHLGALARRVQVVGPCLHHLATLRQVGGEVIGRAHVVALLVGAIAALLLVLTRWQAVHLLPAVWYYRILGVHGMNMLIFFIIY